MQMLTRSLAAVAATSMLVASASAATFYQNAVVDLTPVVTAGATNYIGTGAVAVTWDGTNAYLAGFNSSATTGDTALVKVNNVVTAPTFGARFGVQANTVSGRGYLGLDYKAGVGVASAYDGGQLNATTTPTLQSGSAISLFNTSGTQLGTAVPDVRPAVGPSFDTGSTRLSYMVQGSGAVRNVDVTSSTLAGTGTATTGFTGTNATSLQFRDFDYDAAGNLYARTGNDVVKAVRASASTYTTASASKLADNADANNVGENLSVVEGFASTSSFLIYNDRGSTAAAQAATTVLKALHTADGTAESLSFLNATGSASVDLGSGVALYDFSYDAASQTLALLDFSNNRLFIFGATAAIPEPTTLAVLAGVALVGIRRRRA